MKGIENMKKKKKVALVFIISFQMFPDTFLQTLWLWSYRSDYLTFDKQNTPAGTLPIHPLGRVGGRLQNVYRTHTN